MNTATVAPRMPSMAMTITSSTKVKPDSGFRIPDSVKVSY
jgi:hypothetical protein